MTLTEREQEFLEWLDEQPGYSVKAELVEEQFPDLNIEFVGVTGHFTSDGHISYPKRDYEQAVKYNQVFD